MFEWQVKFYRFLRFQIFLGQSLEFKNNFERVILNFCFKKVLIEFLIVFILMCIFKELMLKDFYQVERKYWCFIKFNMVVFIV